MKDVLRNSLLLLVLVYILSIIESQAATTLRCTVGHDDKVISVHSIADMGVFITQVKENGEQKTYHIGDVSNPSEVEDYVVITDNKYTVVYPMYCKH